MADQATISVSTTVWEKRIFQYMAATGATMIEALEEEWPLLLHKVIDFTPPFKTRAAVKASGDNFGASDYSVGRKAVSHDIYKTMRSFDPKGLRDKGLIKIVQTGNTEAFNLVAARAKSSFMAGAKAVAFSPELHLQRRDSRGRVTGRDSNRVVLGPDAALLRAYVAKVQSHVGSAKDGWSPAYFLVRPPDGWIPPNWVMGKGASGSVVDDRANAEHPSLTAINNSPWAVRQDEGERIKADAYASRINAIKTKIIVKLKLARKQAELNGVDS